MVKALMVKMTPENSFLNEVAITVLRVFVGLTLAFGHGIKKLPPPEVFVQGVMDMGFPAPVLFAWSATLAEFIGGLALAFGLMTRPAAFFIAVTMFVAAFVRHSADPYQQKELALVFLIVSILFVARGASKISIDRFLAK